MPKYKYVPLYYLRIGRGETARERRLVSFLVLMPRDTKFGASKNLKFRYYNAAGRNTIAAKLVPDRIPKLSAKINERFYSTLRKSQTRNLSQLLSGGSRYPRDSGERFYSQLLGQHLQTESDRKIPSNKKLDPNFTR